MSFSYKNLQDEKALDFLYETGESPKAFDQARVFIPTEHVMRYKLNKGAVAPYKKRASDSGYDLTAVCLLREENGVFYYDTGVAVEPSFGYYFDMIPRSSIVKSGYLLANGIGVIDRSYKGTVIIPLIKFRPDAKLDLPKTLVQLVPRRIVHLTPIETRNFRDSDRECGSFGSTG